MRDISFKTSSFRVAVASATLELSSEMNSMIQENTGPKPDILPTARAAAFLAVKNTPMAIPHCHPIPIEDVKVDYTFSETELTVIVKVKAVAKTGLEIEAMHGAQIAALTIYDMMKPLDKSIVIKDTRLLEKQGGKSDFKHLTGKHIRAAVIVVSDSVSAGKKTDKAGVEVMKKLDALSFSKVEKTVVADEPDQVIESVRKAVDAGVDLILTCGGTGLSPRDQTPDALRGMIEMEIPGVMEAARGYGQQRTPHAMLSRGIAGLIGRSLIITLPGSTRGARETMDALFPSTLHIFNVLEKAYQHTDYQND